MSDFRLTMLGVLVTSFRQPSSLKGLTRVLALPQQQQQQLAFSAGKVEQDTGKKKTLSGYSLFVRVRATSSLWM